MCVCVNFHTHVIVVLVWMLLHHQVLRAGELEWRRDGHHQE